ncbi:hypothetical protein BESB_072850 [Besnoitia besnoiti]|uniref:Uncharacterized protein n=1 Tax=Besnoitia besnoiti TaxID=94643 RepID=A0A2A9MEM8_BESBE|nr:uncharacterized protein BESB_072850 [Besnoitia besnoiti]PFH34133.1 hypothetical protein BESB_072850 [Besnoitia besnoiti]
MKNEQDTTVPVLLLCGSRLSLTAARGADAEAVSAPPSISRSGLESALRIKQRTPASHVSVSTSPLSDSSGSDRGAVSPSSGGATPPAATAASTGDRLGEDKASSALADSCHLAAGENCSRHFDAAEEAVKTQAMRGQRPHSTGVFLPTLTFETAVASSKGIDGSHTPSMDSTLPTLSSVPTTSPGTPASCRSQILYSRANSGHLSDSNGSLRFPHFSACSSRASSLSIPSTPDRSQHLEASKHASGTCAYGVTEEVVTSGAARAPKKIEGLTTPQFPGASRRGGAGRSRCGAASCLEAEMEGPPRRLSKEELGCAAPRLPLPQGAGWGEAAAVDTPSSRGNKPARRPASPPRPHLPPPPPLVPETPLARSCGAGSHVDVAAQEVSFPVGGSTPRQGPPAPPGNGLTRNGCAGPERSRSYQEGPYAAMVFRDSHMSQDLTKSDVSPVQGLGQKCRAPTKELTAVPKEGAARFGAALFGKDSSSRGDPVAYAPWCVPQPPESAAQCLHTPDDCQWREAVSPGATASISHAGLSAPIHGRGRTRAFCCGGSAAACARVPPQRPQSPPSCRCCRSKPAPPGSPSGRSISVDVHRAVPDTGLLSRRNKRSVTAGTSAARDAFAFLEAEAAWHARALYEAEKAKGPSATAAPLRLAPPGGLSPCGGACAHGPMMCDSRGVRYEQKQLPLQGDLGPVNPGHTIIASGGLPVPHAPSSGSAPPLPPPPRSGWAGPVPAAVPMPTVAPVPISFPPTTSSAPVSLLLTLPLNLPFGHIIKFGVPSMVAGANSTPQASTARAATLRKQRGFERNLGDAGASCLVSGFGAASAGPGASSPTSARSLGAKKSYYCFSPMLHEAAYTLLSHSGGICDTFAASLHLELAILYLPPAVLPWIAAAFNYLAETLLPRFEEPLRLECGGLQERNAPGRFGGKVLTVGCAIGQEHERQKFQRMQEFFSQFEFQVENILRAYNLQQSPTRARGATPQAVTACEGARPVDAARQEGPQAASPGGAASTAGTLLKGELPGTPASVETGDGGAGDAAPFSGGPPSGLGSTVFGRKHNIWRYSMNCVPSSVLPSPLPPAPPSEYSSSNAHACFQQPRRHRPCAAAPGGCAQVFPVDVGMRHVNPSSCFLSSDMHATLHLSDCRSTDCSSSGSPPGPCEEGAGSAESASAGRGPCASAGVPSNYLDLTVRAFETRPLEKPTREYARLVVSDICVSEVRLVTTRGIDGMTCEIDPRFQQYSIGTRPILTTLDGQLCRHSLAPHRLSDIWEVRLKTQAQLTREQQKRLVEQYIVGEIERRPQADQRRLLDAITRLGAALWVNGRPAGVGTSSSPPPLPAEVPGPPQPMLGFSTGAAEASRNNAPAPWPDRGFPRRWNDGLCCADRLADAIKDGEKADREERVRCIRDACVKADGAGDGAPAAELLALRRRGYEAPPGLSACYAPPPPQPSQCGLSGPDDRRGLLHRGGCGALALSALAERPACDGIAELSTPSHRSSNLHQGAIPWESAEKPTRETISEGLSTAPHEFAQRDAEDIFLEHSLFTSPADKLSQEYSQGTTQSYKRIDDEGNPLSFSVSTAASDADQDLGMENVSMSSSRRRSCAAACPRPRRMEAFATNPPRGSDQQVWAKAPWDAMEHSRAVCSRQIPSGRALSSPPPSPEVRSSCQSAQNRSGRSFRDSNMAGRCGVSRDSESERLKRHQVSERKSNGTGKKAVEFSLNQTPLALWPARHHKSSILNQAVASDALPAQGRGESYGVWNDERTPKRLPLPQNCTDAPDRIPAEAAATFLKQLLATHPEQHIFECVSQGYSASLSTDIGVCPSPSSEAGVLFADGNQGVRTASAPGAHQRELDDVQQLLMCEWVMEGTSLLPADENDVFAAAPGLGQYARFCGM